MAVVVGQLRTALKTTNGKLLEAQRHLTTVTRSCSDLQVQNRQLRAENAHLRSSVGLEDLSAKDRGWRECDSDRGWAGEGLDKGWGRGDLDKGWPSRRRRFENQGPADGNEPCGEATPPPSWLPMKRQ